MLVAEAGVRKTQIAREFHAESSVLCSLIGVLCSETQRKTFTDKKNDGEKR